MDHAIVYDAEFLTIAGAMHRWWCGPHDPDPVVVQIGAVKLGLTGGFDIEDQRTIYVAPRDRFGEPIPLHPDFTALTGVSDADITAHGRPLGEALAAFDAFSDGAMMWSWGRDDNHVMAISCYVEGIAPPIPARRFGNATRLLLKAGMPLGDMLKTSSTRLAEYYGLAHRPGRAHDGLEDALSVAHVLQYLLRKGKLSSQDLRQDLGPSAIPPKG